MIATLSPYPAYRETDAGGLGQIPGHWGVRRIKTLFRERDERSGDGVGVLLSLTRARGIVPQADASNRMASAEDLSKYKLCRPGDLVMNRMQAWSGMFALAAIQGLVSPDYSVFEATGGSDVKYFEHLFKTPRLVDEFARRSKGIGSGFNRLYTPDFGAVPVTVPPIDEQTAIVRFLDHADRRIRRYIAAKKKLISLLHEQKQTIIYHAVTRGLDTGVQLKPAGIPSLGLIPSHWGVRRLGRMAKVFNGTTPSRAQPAYWSDGNIPWLASGKVNDRLITTPSELITARALNECGLSLVPSGALLIGLVGQGRTRGMCAVLAIDSCINQNLAAIIPGSALTSQFLYYVILASYEDIREFGRGGNQAALNCEIVGRLPVPVPPLEEQKAICQAVDIETAHLRTVEHAIGREIVLLQEYRTRLVSDVVSGKIDVRDAAARLPDEIGDRVTLDNMGVLGEGDESEDEADLDTAAGEAES